MPDPITTPAPVAPTTPPEWHTLPQDWQNTLPDDLKAEESLKLFKDVPSIAKSLIHAQKQFGADKMAVPTKYSSEQDWNQIYQKLGLPQKVEEYNIEVPKDLGFEGERLAELKVAAHKAGILPKQLQALMAFHEADTKKVLHSSQEKVNKDLEDAKNQLKQEWGAAHDKNLAQAKFVIKTLNDPKLVEFLETSRLGDHPQMVKVFAKLGEMLGEKKVEGLGAEIGKFGSVKTPDVAKREIAAIQGSMEHPYNNAKHPGHHMAVEEMQALFQQAFPHVDSGA